MAKRESRGIEILKIPLILQILILTKTRGRLPYSRLRRKDENQNLTHKPNKG